MEEKFSSTNWCGRDYGPKGPPYNPGLGPINLSPLEFLPFLLCPVIIRSKKPTELSSSSSSSSVSSSSPTLSRVWVLQWTSLLLLCRPLTETARYLSLSLFMFAVSISWCEVVACICRTETARVYWRISTAIWSSLLLPSNGAWL